MLCLHSSLWWVYIKSKQDILQSMFSDVLIQLETFTNHLHYAFKEFIKVMSPMYSPLFCCYKPLTKNVLRTKAPKCAYSGGFTQAPASIMHELTEMNLQHFISWCNGAQVFHKV